MSLMAENKKKIKKLEVQNSKIIGLFKKIVSYHIGTNSALGMKQLANFFKDILKELNEL